MNTKQSVKTWVVWINIAYVICYLLVLLFPGLRISFIQALIHTEITGMTDSMSLGNFLMGLVLWNIVTLLGVLLFAFLFNKFKK